jgi:hypothetical protein
VIRIKDDLSENSSARGYDSALLFYLWEASQTSFKYAALSEELYTPRHLQVESVQVLMTRFISPKAIVY